MIVSDDAFKADIMREMGKICGFKQGVTSAYHPQANGKVERLHRDMKAYLKIWGEKPGSGTEFYQRLFLHIITPQVEGMGTVQHFSHLDEK